MTPSAHRLARVAVAAILAAAVWVLATAGETEPERSSTVSAESYRRARALIETARARHGEAAALAGGVVIEASGVRNQGVERQGRTPGNLDPSPYREVIAIDPALERAALEYRHRRPDGTGEWIREVYAEPGRQRIVVLEDRFAVELAAPRFEAARRKVMRRLPRLLLAEVAAEGTALRALAGDDEREAVAARLATGEAVTLLFDRGSGLLTGAEYLIDLPTYGDATVGWELGGYRRVEGLGMLPGSYRVTIDGRPFLDLEIERVRRDPAAVAALFALPEDIAPPTVRELPESGDASAGARVEEVAPGVYRVADLRQGFHPLFVELADAVVAIDAPAGYPLLHELPAGDVAPPPADRGPAGDWLSRRYLELIAETVPDKPVRYLVLTHFHNDHAGGLRAFVAAGATVLAPPDSAAAIERLVAAPHTLAPDRLAAAPRPLALEIVQGRRTLGSGERAVEVIDVGANPHTDHMLVVHLPHQGIVYVSDLLTAVPLERFPTPSHRELDRFFGRWLAASGLDPETVYTAHGSGSATAEHLAKLAAAEEEDRP